MNFLMILSAFVSTNLDDLMVLALLYQQARDPRGRRSILLGQYLGIFTLVFASMLLSGGLSALLADYIHLMGLVPMFLGVRALISLLRKKEDEAPVLKPGVLSVAGLAIANGGDNLGVYVPFFSSLDIPGKLLSVLVFGVMIFLWCFLARNLVRAPVISRLLDRFGALLVGIVFLAIGLGILL